MLQKWKYWAWAYLTGPIQDRKVHRIIRKRQPKKIVEIGMGTGSRALRIIESAQFHAPGERIEYTGVDLFEGRPGRPLLQLIAAHRMLKQTKAQIRLAPGDPLCALERIANCLLGVDLIVISPQTDVASMDAAWFYLPRMMTESTIVLEESANSQGRYTGTCVISYLEAQRRAKLAAPIEVRALAA